MSSEFVSKAKHSTSQSMPQPLMPKKLKLNDSMKTYMRHPKTNTKTNTKKRCPFHYRGLECKSRKIRENWNKRQVWPWSTKWSKAKANRVLPRDHTSHSKYSLPTTQETTVLMDITRWSIQKSDLLYSLQPKMEKLYTVNKRWPVADSGSDHVSSLLQNSDFTLKKVGKTTRPFKYDLNQIPYD